MPPHTLLRKFSKIFTLSAWHLIVLLEVAWVSASNYQYFKNPKKIPILYSIKCLTGKLKVLNWKVSDLWESTKVWCWFLCHLKQQFYCPQNLKIYIRNKNSHKSSLKAILSFPRLHSERGLDTYNYVDKHTRQYTPQGKELFPCPVHIYAPAPPSHPAPGKAVHV